MDFAFNMVAVSAGQHIASAVLASTAPKSVGCAFRVKDDWNAPEDVFNKTVIREGATLAQIAGYSIGMERFFRLLETVAKASLQKKGNPLLASALKKFQGNQVMFLILLACTSNFLAETFSRKLAPRDIWDKLRKDTICHKPHEDDDEDFRQQLFSGQSQRQPVMFAHNPQPGLNRATSPFYVPPARSSTVPQSVF